MLPQGVWVKIMLSLNTSWGGGTVLRDILVGFKILNGLKKLLRTPMIVGMSFQTYI